MADYVGLAAGYGVALVGWIGTARLARRLWPRRAHPRFERPWRELGLALLAVAGVIGVGQLWVHGLLLDTGGGAGVLLEGANQVLIFLPVVLLLIVRRAPPATAWLPLDRVWLRLVLGALLATAATAAFAATRLGTERIPEALLTAVRPQNFQLAVQVFLEDLTIAVLFVRLAAVTGRPRSTAIATSALFALGHAPAQLAQGAALAELWPLGLDFALGAAVLLVVQRSADIWWFFCVHFAMDMTQFLET